MVDGSVVLEVEGAGLCNLLASLPPAARLLKGCNSTLYHCFFLTYDGNVEHLTVLITPLSALTRRFKCGMVKQLQLHN